MPFFMSPVIIFLMSWCVSLASLAFSVTTVSYPLDKHVFFVFFVSLASFLVGVLITKIIHAVVSFGPSRQEPRLKDMKIAQLGDERRWVVLGESRLRLIAVVLFALSLAIILYNIHLDGLPPFFAFIGYAAKPYLEYGRFLALLIPSCSMLVLMSRFISSKPIQYFMFVFGFAVMVLYVNRGPIIITVVQYFLLSLCCRYSLTRSVKKYYLRLFFVSVLLGVFVFFVMKVMGEYRSGSASFYEYLKIRDEYAEDYDIGLLWFLSYFSIPASNFFWYYTSYSDVSLSLSFLSRALPSFLWVVDDSIVGNINALKEYMIDYVHFYLFEWYAGLGLVGIVLVNMVYGFAAELFKRFLLVYVIMAGVLFFMFFIDYLLYFSTLFQMLVAVLCIYKNYQPQPNAL